MKRIHPFFLSCCSGILLFAAWPVSPLTFLIFIGFVPLLWMEQQGMTRSQFFGWTYVGFLIWNAATTWWTCNSTLPGGIAAITANSLLMSLPWIGFYNIKKRMGEKAGYLSLFFFWLCFEYIHLRWELSWPWLTLGNVFATHPGWVQWYEYTGVSGGSSWILCVNLWIFFWLRKKWTPAKSFSPGIIPQKKRFSSSRTYGLVFLLGIPFALSFEISHNSGSSVPPGDETPAIRNIVVVQPNIDPWDEKFVAGKEESQLQSLIRLSELQIDNQTALVVWPETAIPVAIDEDSVKTAYFLAPIWNFMRRHPQINLLTGMEGFRFYTKQNKTVYSQRVPESNFYADRYNSAFLMDSDRFQIYHKSKLVPGAELLPSFLRFMDSWFEKFGGTAGGYARQSERTVMSTYNRSYRVAPSICYESIYGEFMSTYIRNGADLICIITNDGWWGNTAGYQQHENYARLRAIETRRWITRSANTGISCFIDPWGNVMDLQPWNKKVVIKRNVPATKTLTFYVKQGDLLFKAGFWMTLALMAWNIFVIIQTRLAREKKD